MQSWCHKNAEAGPACRFYCLTHLRAPMWVCIWWIQRSAFSHADAARKDHVSFSARGRSWVERRGSSLFKLIGLRSSLKQTKISTLWTSRETAEQSRWYSWYNSSQKNDFICRHDECGQGLFLFIYLFVRLFVCFQNPCSKFPSPSPWSHSVLPN